MAGNTTFAETRNILLIKDAPYILTIIVSVLSFNLNYLIKDLSESPVIEYHFDNLSTTPANPNNGYAYEQQFNLILSNIAKNTSFDSIYISFVYPGSGPSGRFKDFSVLHESITSNPVASSPSLEHAAFFNVMNFQPNTSYVFQFAILSRQKEFNHPQIEPGSKGALYFRNRGLETWLIRHQLALNLYFALVLLIVVTLYITILIRRNR